MNESSFNYVIPFVGLNGFNIYIHLAKYFKNIIILNNSNFKFNLKISPNYKIKKNDIIFWTSEKYQYFINKCIFYPNNITFPIDDKYKFSQFIKKFGEKPIPYFKSKNEITNKTDAYVIKTKKSIIKNRLRGKIIKFVDIPNKISEDYFIQKYIKNGHNNISVCGYFNYKNSKDNVLLLTKKIVTYGGQFPCGALVMTVDEDKHELYDRTTKLLNNIKYIGPFELEFIKCLDESKIFICELNSRFWMQNGIFNLNGRNIIIDRYLNIENIYNEDDFKNVIWIYNSKINDTISLKMKQVLNKYKNTHRIVLSHNNTLSI